MLLLLFPFVIYLQSPFSKYLLWVFSCGNWRSNGVLSVVAVSSLLFYALLSFRSLAILLVHCLSSGLSVHAALLSIFFVIAVSYWVFTTWELICYIAYSYSWNTKTIFTFVIHACSSLMHVTYWMSCERWVLEGWVMECFEYLSRIAYRVSRFVFYYCCYCCCLLWRQELKSRDR